jgi:hypothetical protein
MQMAWVIADKSISPALRSLQLGAEKGTSIPVGCRRMHPDLSHLRHLSITRDIYLCINFICHLLPLRCVLPAPVGAGFPHGTCGYIQTHFGQERYVMVLCKKISQWN